MSHYAFADNMGSAFQKAHSAIWERAGTTAMSLKEQMDGWKTSYGVIIKGGPYDPDSSVDKVMRPILLEFESKEAYVLFMLEWS